MIAFLLIAAGIAIAAGLRLVWPSAWPEPRRTEPIHVSQHLDEQRRQRLLLSTLDHTTRH